MFNNVVKAFFASYFDFFTSDCHDVTLPLDLDRKGLTTAAHTICLIAAQKNIARICIV